MGGGLLFAGHVLYIIKQLGVPARMRSLARQVRYNDADSLRTPNVYVYTATTNTPASLYRLAQPLYELAAAVSHVSSLLTVVANSHRAQSLPLPATAVLLHFCVCFSS